MRPVANGNGGSARGFKVAGRPIPHCRPLPHNCRMLTRLAIRDFAVVSASEMEFGPGMTVISGETGAGKSLLVDALAFLSGQRADSGMVRHGAARAELHAEFELADCATASAWLAEQELDEGGQCQLRRTINADGGSRAWINGRPATIGQLAALAGLLVEIHGQHEHQALLSRPAQLALLDAFGGHEALLAEVSAHAGRWRQLRNEREALFARGDVGERIDWLGHQIDELAAEQIAPEAIATLIASHRRHAHGASLSEACARAAAGLAGEDGPGPGDALQRVRQVLAKVAEHEPRLGEVDAMLDAAAIQMDEADQLLERIRDDLELDPADFEQLDRRLTRLHDLARKHRVTPERLQATHDALAEEREQLQGATQRLGALDTEIEQARQDWLATAVRLGEARQRSGKRLSAEVTAVIAELGMGGGVFEAELSALASEDPDPSGSERVDFLVSANAGQPPRPLRKVASGGELARISLAIEVAALGKDAVPSMVFDEVDTGIGGAVAQIVGQKLRQLGQARQVLCVTHLPQVAAQGHAHYRVSKAASEGVTSSEVQLLDEAQRVEELARMLGGVDIGEEARAAAARLRRDAEAS